MGFEGGAVVNDTTVWCQSRGVTEPAGETESHISPLKKAHLFTDVLFSAIFAVGEFYAQVRDIAFGNMRFAR